MTPLCPAVQLGDPLGTSHTPRSGQRLCVPGRLLNSELQWYPMLWEAWCNFLGISILQTEKTLCLEQVHYDACVDTRFPDFGTRGKYAIRLGKS